MATVAVFIVLGGGAYAATSLPKGSVGTKQLKDRAVTTQKLKRAAITTAKLKNGSVNSSKVALGALTAANLAPGTINGEAVQGGSALNLSAGQSIVYPIGQTSSGQGSAVAPVQLTVGNLHVVSTAAPATGEALTLTLVTASPPSFSSLAATGVSCTVVGPNRSCSTDATATVPAGDIYDFLASRGATTNGVNFGYTIKPT